MDFRLSDHEIEITKHVHAHIRQEYLVSGPQYRNNYRELCFIDQCFFYLLTILSNVYT